MQLDWLDTVEDCAFLVQHEYVNDLATPRDRRSTGNVVEEDEGDNGLMRDIKGRFEDFRSWNLHESGNLSGLGL